MTMTNEEKKEHEETIRKILRAGDTITHIRCMGTFEEHVFTKYETRATHAWLCGKPTKDTVRFGGSKYEANDISFFNVTHINRVPVGVCEFAVEFRSRLEEHAK